VSRGSLTRLPILILAGGTVLAACGGTDTGREGGAKASLDASADAGTPRSAPWASGAWVRSGSAGAVTGGYATLHNPGATPLTIAGVISADADTVELHESMEHDGMVHMSPRTELVLPAGDSLVMAPGGTHFMILGLRRDLSAGETFPMRIVFRQGDTLDVVADVRPIGAR
jgi:periplasmic copper chaperone A